MEEVADQCILEWGADHYWLNLWCHHVAAASLYRWVISCVVSAAPDVHYPSGGLQKARGGRVVGDTSGNDLTPELAADAGGGDGVGMYQDFDDSLARHIHPPGSGSLTISTRSLIIDPSFQATIIVVRLILGALYRGCCDRS